MSDGVAHTVGDLRQMQSLPLRAKVIMTQQRIKAWYEYFNGGVYVSFSGGKDSTVLLHLAREVYSDIPAVFCNTGLEYPEITRFVMKQKDVQIVKPEMNFADVIDVYGYPIIGKEIAQNIRTSRKYLQRGDPNEQTPARMKKLKGELMNPDGTPSQYNCARWGYMLDAPFEVGSGCCDVMKKRPIHKYEKATGRKPILGTMADEGRERRRVWMKNGCNAWNAKHQVSTPLAFWTENDVLQYIKENEIPYADIYGDIVEDGQMPGQQWWEGYNPGKLKTTGCARTGCIFCGFGCHFDSEPTRYQKLKETHKTLYDFCIRDTTLISKRSGQDHKQIAQCKNNTEINMLVKRERERLGSRFNTYYETKKGLGFGRVLDYIHVPYK